MKTITLIIALSFASLLTAMADNHETKKGAFRHVVCFKFKKDATPEQIKTIEKSFGELPAQIKTIKGYEWGTSVGDAARAKGYTHCFVVTFADKAGLDTYIPHAAHQEFVKQLKLVLEDAFVFDFVAQ